VCRRHTKTRTKRSQGGLGLMGNPSGKLDFATFKYDARITRSELSRAWAIKLKIAPYSVLNGRVSLLNARLLPTSTRFVRFSHRLPSFDPPFIELLPCGGTLSSGLLMPTRTRRANIPSLLVPAGLAQEEGHTKVLPPMFLRLRLVSWWKPQDPRATFARSSFVWACEGPSEGGGGCRKKGVGRAGQNKKKPSNEGISALLAHALSWICSFELSLSWGTSRVPSRKPLSHSFIHFFRLVGKMSDV
jgi:hypothetical protein